MKEGGGAIDVSRAHCWFDNHDVHNESPNLAHVTGGGSIPSAVSYSYGSLRLWRLSRNVK